MKFHCHISKVSSSDSARECFMISAEEHGVDLRECYPAETVPLVMGTRKTRLTPSFSAVFSGSLIMIISSYRQRDDRRRKHSQVLRRPRRDLQPADRLFAINTRTCDIHLRAARHKHLHTVPLICKDMAHFGAYLVGREACLSPSKLISLIASLEDSGQQEPFSSCLKPRDLSAGLS